MQVMRSTTCIASTLSIQTVRQRKITRSSSSSDSDPRSHLRTCSVRSSISLPPLCASNTGEGHHVPPACGRSSHRRIAPKVVRFAIGHVLVVLSRKQVGFCVPDHIGFVRTKRVKGKARIENEMAQMGCAARRACSTTRGGTH
jgi:hypothetical protein